MVDILNHDEKQVVLYSKGHFVKSDDTVEDLKTLVATAYEFPVTSAQFFHVYNYVVKLFLKLQETKYIEMGIEEFLNSLFSWDMPVLKPEDMLNKMMARIAWVGADKLNLGEADSKYLPVKEKVNN